MNLSYILLQLIVLLLGQPHEGAVLGSGDALNVDGIAEVSQMLVGLADAVVLGTVAVLDIGHTPSIIADELESAGTFTLLLALETDVVVLDRLPPTRGQLLGGGCIDAWLAAFLLDEHVVKAIGGQVVDISIDGGIAPVEE